MPKKKKKNVSGNPTDPVKNSPTLIFFSCFPKIKTQKLKKDCGFAEVSCGPVKEYRRISQLAYRRLYNQYMRMCSTDKMAASSSGQHRRPGTNYVNISQESKSAGCSETVIW